MNLLIVIVMKSLIFFFFSLIKHPKSDSALYMLKKNTISFNENKVCAELRRHHSKRVTNSTKIMQRNFIDVQ